MEPYTQLNSSQRAAVETIDGPLLVLAGPGTGKTQLLSIRAANILAKRSGDIKPENILIVTYTNSAAKALKERLVKIIGQAGYDIEVGTFHSFANSIIQESQEAANYVGEKLKMDDVEQLKAVRYILDRSDNIQAIRPFRAPYFYLNDIIKRISELKKDGIDPKGFKTYVESIPSRGVKIEEPQFERLKGLARVYEAYEAAKSGGDPNIFDERGRYDFDDMILFAVEALKKERLLAQEYAGQYKLSMVDEFEDTNEAQLELLFTLLDTDNPNLCCVGDDDQSIYRFQGASVANFRMLKERFPSIKVMTLKDNYRSTKPIIDFAAALIGTLPKIERTGEKALIPVRDCNDTKIELREFTTETEELLFMVDRIRALKGAIAASGDPDSQAMEHPYNEIAVLVRKRSDILKVIDAFLQAGIPYATDGREDISGEKRVKQLLDVLDLANMGSDSPRQKDLALYKVLSADYLKIPLAEIIQFFSYANSRRRSPDNAPLAQTVLELFLRQAPSAEMQTAHSAITRLLRGSQTNSVHSILLNFIDDAGIFKFILEKFDSKEVLKIRDLRAVTAFVNMVKTTDIASPGIRLNEFMEDLKLRKANGLPIQGDLVTMTQDGVRIFTAHSSKGMEFHTVFIPFCLQNRNWPSRRLPDKIVIPPDLFKTREDVKDDSLAKQLFLQDETRLFYVASTRARSNLIFTASPQANSISSQYLKSLKDTAPEAAGADVNEKALLIDSISQSAGNADELVGASSILRDIVKAVSLNPTSLNNYLTCRRKFLYDNVLMLPGAKRQSLAFGSCSHKALEELYQVYKLKRSFPDFGFFKNAFIKELAFQGVDEAMESRCLAQLKTLEGWFNRAAKNPARPLEIELKITATVAGGVPFVGKLDKIEAEGASKNLVKVVDYKTGKPDDHLSAVDKCGDMASKECDGYLRQLAAYKLLMERDKRFSKLYDVRRGELVFLEPVSKDMKKAGLKKGDFVNKTIALDDEMVRSLEKVIKDVWDCIQALKFEKFAQRDRQICAFCDFDGICWQ